MQKYWGSCMPHDSIGMLPLSNHVTKHVGATIIANATLTLNSIQMQ
jgi:hypothetical protein